MYGYGLPDGTLHTKRKGGTTIIGMPRLNNDHWIDGAGYPKAIISDCGLNNRGVFVKEMNVANVHCSNIELEEFNQIAKAERHGGMWKMVAEKVVQERQVTEPR